MIKTHLSKGVKIVVRNWYEELLTTLSFWSTAGFWSPVTPVNSLREADFITPVLHGRSALPQVEQTMFKQLEPKA